ncbi:MAG: hypothetical protein ACI4Q8_02610 [Ruminococcus sp.]
MTLDELQKNIEIAYSEMNRERALKQAELEAYFKGYEKGLDRSHEILRSHIYFNKEGELK